MKRTPYISCCPAFCPETIAFKPVHKPRLTMIWVTELIGDRARLVARWTTQD